MSRSQTVTHKLLNSLLVGLVASFCNENKLAAQSASISGVVKDKTTLTALQNVNIALFKKQDSLLVKGVITNEDGSFAISNLQNGSYYLTASSVAYQPKTLAVIYDGNHVAIGIIELQPSENNLQSITVSGKQNRAKQNMDKQIYKASIFQNAKGGTALDVIKNLPSVSVNSLDEISVRGTDGLQILLNGKQVRGDMDVILSQIPANSIENIELITSPSAKFDAEGKAGIINIITKQQTANGFYFTANIQGGLPSFHRYNNPILPQRFGGDASLTYNKNKWSFSGAVSYLRNDATGRREGNAYTIINNIRTDFPSVGERSFIRKNYSARTAIVFAPDKNNSFSIGLYAGRKFQARMADLNYHNLKTNLTTNTVFQPFAYYNANLQTKEANLYLGNIDYTHSFKNKSSFTASFLYEYDDLYGNTKNLNKYNAQTADTLQYTHNTNTNPLHGYKALVSYNYNIGKLKMESGYQYRHDHQDGNFIYLTNVLHTQQYVADSNFTSHVITDNSIHAVYTQLASNTNKWQYSAGIRYEYTKRLLSFSNSVLQGNTLRLSNLFPSASLLYSFDNKWKWRAAYSRRIQRTANFELNPFPEREHSETLEQGDPNLLPTFTGSVETGITKDFKKGSLFITAYNQQIKNPVQRLNNVYNDTILYRVYTNAGKAHQWGMEAGITAKPATWLQLYAGGNVFDYSISGSIFNHSISVNNAGWAYSANGNLTFVFTSNWNLQMGANYTSRQVTAQGYNSSFFSPNLSLKKTFLSGRLNATLQWQNIDLGSRLSNRQRITTMGDNFYTTTNYIVEPDIVLLNLGFTLKQSDKKIKLPASEFGDKEF